MAFFLSINNNVGNVGARMNDVRKINKKKFISNNHSEWLNEIN
jgi:hypothetical protein